MELPPVIMTAEEIETAEEQAMDTLRDRLEELERKPERKPRKQGHYSPEQLGELWGLSSDTIRRLFEHEPGVLIIGRESDARRYRTLRIPSEVAERVQRRLSNPERR